MDSAPSSRAEVTRRRIVDATLEVIATEGVRAVTHRRVAAKAGSSLGLITYHFASTESLIAATLETLARREALRLTELRDTVTRLGDDVDGLIDLLANEVGRWTGVRKQEVVASFALTLEIPRDGISRTAFDAWEGAQLALYQAVAAATGSDDPDLGMYLLASMDGLVLYSAIAPDPANIVAAARAGLQRLLRPATDH